MEPEDNRNFSEGTNTTLVKGEKSSISDSFMTVRRTGDKIYYTKDENIWMHCNEICTDEQPVKKEESKPAMEEENTRYSDPSFKTLSFNEYQSDTEVEKCVAFWKAVMERNLQPVKANIIQETVEQESTDSFISDEKRNDEINEAVKKATDDVHAEYRKLWKSLIKELQAKKLDQVRKNINKQRCHMCIDTNLQSDLRTPVFKQRPTEVTQKITNIKQLEKKKKYFSLSRSKEKSLTDEHKMKKGKEYCKRKNGIPSYCNCPKSGCTCPISYILEHKLQTDIEKLTPLSERNRTKSICHCCQLHSVDSDKELEIIKIDLNDDIKELQRVHQHVEEKYTDTDDSITNVYEEEIHGEAEDLASVEVKSKQESSVSSNGSTGTDLPPVEVKSKVESSISSNGSTGIDLSKLHSSDARKISMMLPTGEVEIIEREPVEDLTWEKPQIKRTSIAPKDSFTLLKNQSLFKGSSKQFEEGQHTRSSSKRSSVKSNNTTISQKLSYKLPSGDIKVLEREHVDNTNWDMPKHLNSVTRSLVASVPSLEIFKNRKTKSKNPSLKSEERKSILKNSGNRIQSLPNNSDDNVSAVYLKAPRISNDYGFSSVYQYQIKSFEDTVKKESLTSELLVKNFFWAQWDACEQTLYYIHNKHRNRGLVAGEEITVDNNTKVIPTLTGLQFHDDQPHESVLNIPLNLPHLSTFNSSATYEDDVVPLRIHDSSLDLIVLTNPTGCVCICHNYLYQPIQPTVSLEDDDDTTPINFAYSVTALHQSCVITCVINDIPWSKAKTIRPLFKLRGDSLIVFIPEICTHILDVGLLHEPVCHVTTNPLISDKAPHQLYLAPLISADDYIINLYNLDIIDGSVLENLMIETFKSDTILENKLAILHYLLLHMEDVETASELICWHSASPFTIDYPELLKEFLLATSYASVRKNLPLNAAKLATLLPITTLRLGLDMELKNNDYLINLRQEVLWNASMMVISPQLRITPYKSDLWVKLWDHLAKLSKAGLRFRSSQVLDKLRISLDCYQPEALSRCSTPLSPSGGASSTFTDSLSGTRNQTDFLPFYEMDSCTASRQEHIISVNLRELSMHLLKQTSDTTRKFQMTDQSAMHVHSVATRYVGAQLEQSRQLCQIVCKAATYNPAEDMDKGFILVNNLDEDRRYIFFKLLEKYYMAVESLAFPLPQGFTSFFTYLGYRTMEFEMFEQYVINHVCELQVDVMKIILAEEDESKENTAKKLKLLSLLPRQRAKRLLNQWNHPIGVVLRAREHAHNILSGVTGLPTRSRNQNLPSIKGLGSFSSSNNMSPLDTFLDLLTAKASLADIDFGLLIEATETYIEDVL